MKIGIYLNYGPNTKLMTEGLGRYLGELVHGFIDNDNEVLIVCPKWLKKSLKQLFDDLGVDIDRINIISTKHIPVAWKIMSLLTEKKAKRERFGKIKSLVKGIVVSELSSAVKAKSVLDVIMLVLKTLLYLVLGACVLPLVIMTGIVFFLMACVKKFVKKMVKKVRPHIDTFALLNVMLKSVAEELVTIANKQNNVDIWYVPALFWPEVNRIKKTTVINIPDIETEQFSTGFAAYIGSSYQTNMLRETISGGKYFITYCEYIKSSMVEEQMAGMDKQAFAIRHINNDMSKYITIDSDVAKQMCSKRDLTTEFAKNVVDGICNVKISSMRYIFFASQVRANKNMLTLLRAFNELVHKRFFRLKIVLTGKIYDNKEINEYIENNELYNDVIVCNNVSSQQLAALYKCASIVVNPTLYEGGFPFTFGEGMSVGTPSIMSDIPQVADVFKPAGLETALFEPYDYLALADKIEWALDNIDYLYNLELPLYNELKRRTPEVVAREYEDVFRQIIEIAKKDAS